MPYRHVNPNLHGPQRHFRFPNSKVDVELEAVMLSPLKGNDSSNTFTSRNERDEDSVADKHEQFDGKPSDSAYAMIWKPGFWAQLPVMGLLSLFGVLASTLAGIVVLVVSNDLPTEDWGSQFTPAVSMAICSVVASSLLAYALANGLVISFWRTALRGHTLSELNQNWLCGHSLQHAILGGFRAGGRVTAFACIFSVISLLRGPLNQRASRVESNVSYNISGIIPIAVAQQLSEGYTGISRNSRAPIMETSRLTPHFAKVMQEYSERSNISIDIPDHACGDSCTISVKGFGFKTQCDSNEFVQQRATNNSFHHTIFSTSSTLFQIGGPDSTALQYFWPNAGIQLNVTYAVPLLPGDQIVNMLPIRLRTHICNMTGGTVEYKARISSQSISLEANRSNDRFLEDLVLQGPGTFGHESTIGGFQYAASFLFDSEAQLNFAGAVSDLTFTGSLSNQQVQNVSGWEATFGDPMNYMIDTMREIAFRTSVLAGKDKDNFNVTHAEQEIAYEGTATHSIYVTDFYYMAGAAVLSICSVVAVGLTFYGWWELGRNVSLSPLDIARAFDAPLLKLESPGMIGMQRVQYGKEVKENQDAGMKEMGGQYPKPESRRLVMGLTGTVKRPAPGEAVLF